ncbi:hypothetical protein D3874_15270 [Oleomonas cavernae]|uniref:Uncharacterized protein n=1 Tax=Oleomonas cavernae TaxID=2320859 RepID=A0A418WDV9_9PROT|nr:hypothetical protein [Oleomonas cavernae]RJF88207.1 hypothetical protein D3874_15270 [Oleomonas cavernae]
MAPLTLSSPIGDIQIVNEPMHSFGSADNSRAYRREHNLCDGSVRASYGIIVDGDPIVVIGVDRAMPIHSHSALVWGDRLHIALGSRIACFSLNPFVMLRAVEADAVMCFGLHFSTAHSALICHGELQISRLSADGDILWQAGGRDIFTGEFALRPACIEARDFNNAAYRFRYEDGALI